MSKLKVKVHGRPLAKAEPELMQHLATLRAASPESARFLAQRLFGDSMVKGVGNKLAWEDFQSRPREGVHTIIDANDFGKINKQWGQSEGDEAIKAFGGALSRASRANRGKLFRVGGDEFRAHFDTPEHAYAFARQARQEMEALPPVKGQHFHSASIGFGHSPEHSEQALIEAKNAKAAAGYAPGHAQTHAHSLLQGAVGPVSVKNESGDIPPGIRKPVQPGASPMAIPSASEPWPMAKSESPTTLIHDNPSRPVPVFFLGNDEGLSPDGATFLKPEQISEYYGCDIRNLRSYGFVGRVKLARSIRMYGNGLIKFEE